MKEEWKVYVTFVAIVEALGALTGLLTRGGMMAYSLLEKPALTPPGIVFPIVWTILYALMGIGAARIWMRPASKERSAGWKLFVLQLALNLLWSFVFFNLQNYSLAFFVLIALWVLIWWMICSWWPQDKLGAILQIPYLIWVTFAGYLNYMIMMMN